MRHFRPRPTTRTCSYFLCCGLQTCARFYRLEQQPQVRQEDNVARSRRHMVSAYQLYTPNPRKNIDHSADFDVKTDRASVRFGFRFGPGPNFSTNRNHLDIFDEKKKKKTRSEKMTEPFPFSIHGTGHSPHNALLMTIQVSHSLLCDSYRS